MKRFLAVLFLACGVSAALAGGVPNIPTTPQYSDPSQVLATINALINQLNGTQAYAPVAPIGLGPTCAVTSLTVGTPQTCNGTRGTITTGTMTTAALADQNLQINSIYINANSACVANIMNNSGTFSTNGIPIVYATLPGGSVGNGNLQIFIGNVSTTNALNGTLAIGFYCYN